MKQPFIVMLPPLVQMGSNKIQQCTYNTDIIPTNVGASCLKDGESPIPVTDVAYILYFLQLCSPRNKVLTLALKLSTVMLEIQLSYLST